MENKSTLPCPFCGNITSEVLTGDDFYIRCSKCGSSGALEGSEQRAIDVWNTRSEDKRLSNIREEAKAAVETLDDSAMVHLCEKIAGLRVQDVKL